ncbi:MAG: hypothetical protein KAG66_25185, partial [Methylococcales bacterium]|nr:hypothetical protein [Methylococcales bacterium]
MAKDLLDRYFIEGGKDADQAFAAKPMVGDKRSPLVDALLVVANFVEIYLAKEGHDGLVGINFLHKIQAPLLPSIYGAILAEVDIIIVGAGIPLDIPAIIDKLANNEPAEMKLHVVGASKGSAPKAYFDPRKVLADPPALKRPHFFPVVASVTLATLMVKKCKEGVSGLILEGPTAGGHNAPPRGKTQLNSKG